MYNHNSRNNNSYSFIVIIVIIQTLITESSWNVFMISGFHQSILTVFIDTKFNNEDMQEIFILFWNSHFLFINLLSLSRKNSWETLDDNFLFHHWSFFALPSSTDNMIKCKWHSCNCYHNTGLLCREVWEMKNHN